MSSSRKKIHKKYKLQYLTEKFEEKKIYRTNWDERSIYNILPFKIWGEKKF